MKNRIPLIICLFSFATALSASSALEFNGSDEYVHANSVSTSASAESILTIEAWIYPEDAGGDECYLSFHTSTGSNTILFGILNRKPYVSIGGTSDFGSVIPQNAWTHLAVTVDDLTDTAKVYINGVYDFYTIITQWPTSNGKFSIGQEWDGLSATNFFHGSIDEVRIWNTGRTRSQIREYMCENVSGSTGLLAYYQMSDGSGTSLTDNSGNGHTGTLINMDNSDWVNDNQIPNGDGSTTPYQINGLNQLYWLSQNSAYWGSDFEQITDITASATESWDGGAGFTPIGNSSTYFTGTYNGNDHIISDLTIIRNSIYNVALFGGVNNSGTITNMHVENINISGDYNVGGIVGFLQQGDIITCSSTGLIFGKRYSGGIAGAVYMGSISECFTSATINLLSGRDGDGMGGLTGYSFGTISNSYASGHVDGGTRVGGLIGFAANNSTTSNCYSTGSVSGASNVGGLIGHAEPENEFFGDPGAEVSACFWDTEASGNATSDAGTGKTTAEMKTLSTYTDAGWDFSNESANGSNDFWGINNEQHNGYPFLSWEDYTHNYSDTPLPVCLATFNAENSKGAVKLTWTTESETQNLGYILERKTGGMNWVQVASYLDDVSLEGHGTTTESHNYMYTDSDVIVCQTYEYRLSDVSESNHVNVLKTLSITVKAEDIVTTDKFGISRTYPNPFNPSLTIRYSLTEEAQTSVKILDIQGKIVATLSNKFQSAGSYEIQWTAEGVPSGMYMLEVVSGDKKDLQKVILSK